MKTNKKKNIIKNKKNYNINNINIDNTNSSINTSSLNKKTNNFSIPIWIVGLFFIILTIIFFWDIISGNAFLWEDFVEYVYPVQNLAATSSEIPFWNPFTFGGMPFLADIQVGFFYPMNRIFSLFVGTNGFVPISVMQIITILHFFIALCSMFALMRTLKISTLGSMISAISYSFSFSLVLQLIHPMLLAHLSWLPLVVMFLYKAITEFNIRFGIIGGLIFGMSILSGHPQILLYEGLFLTLFAIYHFIINIKQKELNKKNSIKSFIGGLLLFVIAIGIFQIQYQHTNELSKQVLRTEMTYESSSEGSLDIKQIFTGIVPKMFGYENGTRRTEMQFQLPTYDANNQQITAPYYYYWETGFYFGLVAVLLGLYAFISIPFSNRHKIFFLSISTIGFLFALGSNGFLYGLFHNLPLFGLFRFPSRIMFFVTFSFSAMAGFGFDRLTNEKTNKNELIKILIVIGSIFICILFVLSGLFITNNMQGNTDIISGFAINALILLIIISIFILVQYKNKNITLISGISLVIIAFIDLLIAGGDFNKSQQDASQNYILDKQQVSLFTPTINNLFRVSMRHKDYNIIAMQRNIGMTSNIMLVEGYNPLVLNHYEIPLKTREERNKLWNTKYEITVDTNLKQVYYRDRVATQDFLPRAWFVNDIKVIDSNSLKNYMMNNDIDFSKTVILEQQGNINYKTLSEFDTNYRINFIEYNNNYIKINTNSKTGGILVLSEVYYPAWKAKIDGIDTKIYRANYNFRAINVPSGQHSIEMEYASIAYEKGRLITLITLILSVFGLVITFFKKKSN